MEIQYNKCGDYYLPNLIIEDSAQRSIGKYGRLHRQYLKEHRPIIFTTLLLSGKLYEHLTEINRACTERIHPMAVKLPNPKYTPKPYKKADYPGQKVQIDVKYVPSSCLVGAAVEDAKENGGYYYQYTFIDEYSRFRYLEAFKEHNSYSSSEFINIK